MGLSVKRWTCAPPSGVCSTLVSSRVTEAEDILAPILVTTALTSMPVLAVLPPHPASTRSRGKQSRDRAMVPSRWSYLLLRVSARGLPAGAAAVGGDGLAGREIEDEELGAVGAGFGVGGHGGRLLERYA